MDVSMISSPTNNDSFLIKIGNPWIDLLLNLQNELSYATYAFYRMKGIPTIHLPITTGAISSPMGLGSDSMPVQIDLFGVKTYLADSMQFFLEYGCRFMKNGCFYIMPSFRGEVADKRHLCQFYHSEAEIPGGFAEVKTLVEEYIRYLCQWMLDKLSEKIESIVGTTEHLRNMAEKTDFPVIEYDDAVSLLKNYDGCLKENDCGMVNITALGEQELIHKHGGVVWLCNMDERLVPFYQASDGKGHAICGDLLFGIGEVVGSGQRCTTEEEVLASLQLHQVSCEAYDWYIRMKKNYPILTSGFGMGTERFLMWVLKHDDIRDCQLICRVNGREEYI